MGQGEARDCLFLMSKWPPLNEIRTRGGGWKVTSSSTIPQSLVGSWLLLGTLGPRGLLTSGKATCRGTTRFTSLMFGIWLTAAKRLPSCDPFGIRPSQLMNARPTLLHFPSPSNVSFVFPILASQLITSFGISFK